MAMQAVAIGSSNGLIIVESSEVRNFGEDCQKEMSGPHAGFVNISTRRLLASAMN